MELGVSLQIMLTNWCCPFDMQPARGPKAAGRPYNQQTYQCGRPVSRALWRAFVAEPRVAIRAIITEQQRRPNINFFTAGPPISDYTVATTAASAAASVQPTSLTPGAGPAG